MTPLLRGPIRAVVLLFATTTFLQVATVPVNSDYRVFVPDHYDYIDKLRCITKLDVFVDRGVLLNYSSDFLGSWPGNTNFDCQTNAISFTRGTGIILVIQALKFRKVGDVCKDFVNLSPNNERRCGEIAFGLMRSKTGKVPPPPKFISAYSSLFSWSTKNIFPPQHAINLRKRLVSPGAWVTAEYELITNLHVHGQPALEYEEDLQFMMAYTGFQDCDDTHLKDRMFNCGFGVCILDMFVNDGVVNCPFGDCRDEGGCDNAFRTSPLFAGVNNVTEAQVKTANASDFFTWGAGRGTDRVNGMPVAENAIRDIADQLKEHNDILGRISVLMEKRVESQKNLVPTTNAPTSTRNYYTRSTLNN